MAALTQNMIVESAALLPALLWEDVTDTADPLMQAFPINYVDADKVQYHQYESAYGLSSLRGLGGVPPVRHMTGYRVYELDPAYFGDEMLVDEATLTKAVQPGTLADPLSVSDWLAKIMNDYSVMIASRFRTMLTDMLADGTIRITDVQGNTFQYTIPGYRTYSPSVGWSSNPTTATPINDLLVQKATLQKGTSTSYGPESTILMNSLTLADYFATTQVQSTYRGKYGANFIGLEGSSDLPGLNELHQGFGLPKIVVDDNGYFPTILDAVNRNYSNWTYAIPRGTAIWLGKRKNMDQLGQIQLTRHAGIENQADGNAYPQVDVPNESALDIAKGLYVRAEYRPKMPNGYDVQIGFNGCPVLWYDDSACGITTG